MKNNIEPIKLPRSTPEAQGVKTQAIVNFLEKIKEEKHELHSFMLVKNGSVIAECWWKPYSPQYRHQLFSLSKSFTSIAIGIAVDENLLTPETMLADIFAQEFRELGPNIDEKMQKMTVKNLLTMGTGIEYENWDEGGKNIKNFLSSHIKHEPGTSFFYNSFATYMLSAAITRLTGMKLVDYLMPRLFIPLGIDPVWEGDSNGISFGGFGLNAFTEDIAKFGQMILQKGMWQGKRIVSEKWIDEASSKQISNGSDPENDWAQGYGYQFWRCIPKGVFRGDGAFGQFCIFIPEENSLVIITSNTDMGRVMKLVWEHLLPGLKTSGPPPESSGNEASNLKACCQGLSHLSVNTDAPAYPVFRANYSIKTSKSKPTSHNIDAADVEFSGDECIIALYDDKSKKASSTWLFKNREWVFAASAYDTAFGSAGKYYRICTYGEWKENCFSAIIWHYETPQKLEMLFKFNEDRSELNISFKPGGFDPGKYEFNLTADNIIMRK